METYMEAYIGWSKEHGFKPNAAREIVRYLLVNGYIQLMKEDLALMGDTEFFLGADRIPKQLQERLIELAKGTDRKEWTMDDDYEMEEKEHLGDELEGIHIKDGRVNNVKLGVNRVVKVYQTYDVPVDEVLLK